LLKIRDLDRLILDLMIKFC